MLGGVALKWKRVSANKVGVAVVLFCILNLAFPELFLLLINFKTALF
jgi:hypothetical protein